MIGIQGDAIKLDSELSNKVPNRKTSSHLNRKRQPGATGRYHNTINTRNSYQY